MKKIKLGIIIKVRDLELCRKFYRDILELGEPVMDSNFCVEFRLGDTSLFLTKDPWDDHLPFEKGNLAWFYENADPDHVYANIQACKYRSRCAVTEKAGMQMVMFTDPEGNPFYVSGKLSDNKGTTT